MLHMEKQVTYFRVSRHVISF